MSKKNRFQLNTKLSEQIYKQAVSSNWEFLKKNLELNAKFDKRKDSVQVNE